MKNINKSKKIGSQQRRSTEPLHYNSSGRTKPIVSADYVTGLTDGEGCFYVNVSNSSAYKAGANVQLHFHIKMCAEDRKLLEKVKNTLKCGGVYFQKEKRQNHSQCYRYTVFSKKDILEIIIPFFKKYNLQSSSKRKSFDIFCKIAKLVQNGEHLSKKGVEKIREMKSSMNKKTIGLA